MDVTAYCNSNSTENCLLQYYPITARQLFSENGFFFFCLLLLNRLNTNKCNSTLLIKANFREVQNIRLDQSQNTAPSQVMSKYISLDKTNL